MSDEMDMELSGVEAADQVEAAGADTGAVPESSRGLAGAAALMMVATFLSALTGLVRRSYLYYLYAAREEHALGAFLQASGISDFVYFLVAGGALRTGFVPIFSQFLARAQSDKAWRMFRNTLWIILLFSTLIVGLAMLAAEPLTPLAAWGWRAPQYRQYLGLVTPFMRIMFPAQIFMLIGGLFMGALNAEKHFLWPAVGPIVYNVGIIAATVLSPRFGGLELIAFSVPVAALLGNVLLQVSPLVQRGARFGYLIDFREEGFRRVLHLSLPVILGLTINEISTVVTRSMSTWSDPNLGALAFDVSNRVWKLPTRFIGSGIAIAVFAYLTDHYARHDHPGFKRDFSFGMRSITFLTLPPTLAMLVLRAPIINLLCPGTPPAVLHAAADALFYYSLGILPLSWVYFLARALYARHDMITPVWTGATSEAVCIGLALWLGRPTMMAISGLALANTASNVWQALLMAIVLQRGVGNLDGRRIGESLLRQAVPCAAFALVCWQSLLFCQRLLGAAGLGAKFALVFLPLVPATAVFLLLAWLFRVEELSSAGGMLLRKFRRR